MTNGVLAQALYGFTYPCYELEMMNKVVRMRNCFDMNGRFRIQAV